MLLDLDYQSAAKLTAVLATYNKLDLRHTASYLGGTESELLSLNKIAGIPNGSQRPVLERTDIICRMSSLYNLTKK